MKQRRDHSDELPNASEWQKFGKKDPFRVPDSYFEELEGRVRDQIWKEEPNSKFLSGFGKINVFHTPDNYFEGVLAKFEKRKREASAKQTSFSKLRPFYYLTSIAAALVLLVLFIRPDIFQTDSTEIEFSQLEDVSMDVLLAELKPEELSEDMILESFYQDEWDNWTERESINIDMIEAENADLDDLIDELDVYLLEKELDSLN